jgi:hypothetical protein
MLIPILSKLRVVQDRNLLMVEEGLALYLWHHQSPSHGYRLAVTYCEHYDPRYGQGLNGSSRVRLEEICAFIEGRVEHEAGNGSDLPASPTKR